MGPSEVWEFWAQAPFKRSKGSGFKLRRLEGTRCGIPLRKSITKAKLRRLFRLRFPLQAAFAVEPL